MRVLFRESYGNEKETIYVKSEGKIFPQYLLKHSGKLSLYLIIYLLTIID